jgi:hypothetical protein
MDWLDVTLDNMRDHILGLGSGSVGMDQFYGRTCVHGTSAGTITAGSFVNASSICSTGAYWGSTANAAGTALIAKNWGFSVPSDKTIRGVSVQIQGRYDGESADMFVDCYLTKNGTSAASDLKAMMMDYDYSNFYRYTYPWDSNNEAIFATLWGTTLSYSDVNSSNFGVLLQPSKGGGAEADVSTIYVDHLRLRVHYS